MNFRTGEPTHIEDYLITVRTGPWFGWTDSKNKIYANLVVHDGGTKPTEDATVTVHYTGWTTDGKMFDSSVTRGKPAEFPLRGVIAGWTEGLQLMVVGEKTRFWIPENLAYQGKPGRPAGVESPSLAKAATVAGCTMRSFLLTQRFPNP